jgi:hypothetical protein
MTLLGLFATAVAVIIVVVSSIIKGFSIEKISDTSKEVEKVFE